MNTRRCKLFFVCIGLAGLPWAAGAFESVREKEIAQCLPGEISTWGDGRDRPAVSSPMVFVYRHANAPPWFDEATVVTAITRAANAWEQCGVPARVAVQADDAPPAGAILIQWDEKASIGNFGLANFDQRTLSLGPAAFNLLNTRNPRHDARQTLQMLVSHEMGHLFGLMAHSRRCVDVTSYYSNSAGESCYARDPSQLKSVVEYRSALPTACDIQRCRAANGKTGK
jgi:hypothetical protein